MSSAADLRWDQRGFARTAAPPDIDLSRAPDVRALGVERWTGPGATVTTACYARALPLGWPGEDVEPMVLDRLAGVAASFAGEPQAIATRDPRAWRLASEHGAGRAVLGFDGSDAVGCVLVCRQETGEAACASVSASAALAGAMDAPPPSGIALRIASAMIHHPAVSLAVSLAAIAALGAALVRFRKRPG